MKTDIKKNNRFTQAEKILKDYQVGRTAYREEFSKSLDDTEKQGFYESSGHTGLPHVEGKKQLAVSRQLLVLLNRN